MINIIHTEYTDDTKTTVQVIKERGLRDSMAITKPWEVCGLLDRYFGFGASTQERMVALYTDTRGNVRNIQQVNIGFANGVVCSPRDILTTALLTGAVGIILAHCHPSGDPTPSKEDNEFTKRMKDAAELCGLRLTDHIICTDKTYYSYHEQGGFEK